MLDRHYLIYTIPEKGDGIFDKLTSKETIRAVWDDIEQGRRIAPDVHQQCGLSVESILRESVLRKTLDNITVVFIAFKNFQDKVFGEARENCENILHSDRSSKTNLKDQGYDRRERVRTQPDAENSQASMNDISNISARESTEKYVASLLTKASGGQQMTTLSDRRALLNKVDANVETNYNSSAIQRAISKRLISPDVRSDGDEGFKNSSLRSINMNSKGDMSKLSLGSTFK